MTVTVHSLPVGQLQTNCYLVACSVTKEAIIVDPAAEAERILAEVSRLGLSIRYIINTHGHLDHVLANDVVRKATGAPLLIHAADAGYLARPDGAFARMLGLEKAFLPPDHLVADGEIVPIGQLSFTVLHTPGHTPGGISLYGHGVVFTGDALFDHGVGRTDLPGGNWRQLLSSITTRLFTLADDTIVYPGHGPSTTIGREKTENPYI